MEGLQGPDSRPHPWMVHSVGEGGLTCRVREARAPKNTVAPFLWRQCLEPSRPHDISPRCRSQRVDGNSREPGASEHHGKLSQLGRLSKLESFKNGQTVTPLFWWLSGIPLCGRATSSLSSAPSRDTGPVSMSWPPWITRQQMEGSIFLGE